MSEQPNPNRGKDGSDLVDELRAMGQQLEAAFRATLASDRAKQIQRDLSGGVREITTQLQAALKNVQEDPRVQQAEERGRQAFNQAQQSKVVQDVQETIVTGITQINEQLQKLVERIEAERAAPSTSTTTQHVPVEEEGTETPPTPTPSSDSFAMPEETGDETPSPDAVQPSDSFAMPNTTPPSSATGETKRLDDDDQTRL